MRNLCQAGPKREWGEVCPPVLQRGHRARRSWLSPNPTALHPNTPLNSPPNLGLFSWNFNSPWGHLGLCVTIPISFFALKSQGFFFFAPFQRHHLRQGSESGNNGAPALPAAPCTSRGQSWSPEPLSSLTSMSGCPVQSQALGCGVRRALPSTVR